MESMILTNHAKERIIERNLSPEIIQETVEKGEKKFIIDGYKYEYRLVKGRTVYTVVTNMKNTIITSFKCKKGKQNSHEEIRYSGLNERRYDRIRKLKMKKKLEDEYNEYE